jgi:hypothetical protein
LCSQVPVGQHDPGFAQELYDKWKIKADDQMKKAREELSSGRWPEFGT